MSTRFSQLKNFCPSVIIDKVFSNPVTIPILAGFPNGRQVQEAVPDEEGAGDRQLDQGVEEAG